MLALAGSCLWNFIVRPKKFYLPRDERATSKFLDTVAAMGIGTTNVSKENQRRRSIVADSTFPHPHCNYTVSPAAMVTLLLRENPF